MKKDKKNLAIELREQGLSYGEIKKQINVSKSTLSLWLKDVSLSEENRARLYTKQIKILSRGAPSQRERRKLEIDQIIESAVIEISKPPSRDSLMLMGAALYWAEGSKKHMFSLTNSDPMLISFFVSWVEELFNIQPKDLKVWMNIYPQQNETELKQFWSELTNIPIQNFGKSFVKPISTGYKKNNLYYGTIRVTVPRSTDIRYRVLGWIKGAMQNRAGNIDLIKKRWQHLTEVDRAVNLRP